MAGHAFFMKCRRAWEILDSVHAFTIRKRRTFVSSGTGGPVCLLVFGRNHKDWTKTIGCHVQLTFALKALRAWH